MPKQKQAAANGAAPRYWMISNRAVDKNGFTSELGELAYWTSTGGKLDVFASWTQVDAELFQKQLVAAAGQFDPPDAGGSNADQSHVCFLVHGYNVSWLDNARRYQQLCKDLFTGNNGLGICIAFDWPSFGHTWDYLPDREHARKCAQDLATVLSALYEWLLKKQLQAACDSSQACRAKVSMIVHSMGNYLTQKAMSVAWTRKNQPLLVTLINQLVMVAADVDNDLFNPGTAEATDGTAMTNLTYRITALYSGRDEILGASAGLKHFGVRRLGRSGLATRPPPGKDNVWDVDCSSFFPKSVDGGAIHGAYFQTAGTIALMRQILRGMDRGVIETTHLTKGTAWP